MSLGRLGLRSSRGNPTLSVLGNSGMDRTVCSSNIHVHWQPSPSFGIQFKPAAAFQCVQEDGEKEFVMTNYQWAVFCLLTPKMFVGVEIFEISIKRHRIDSNCLSKLCLDCVQKHVNPAVSHLYGRVYNWTPSALTKPKRLLVLFLLRFFFFPHLFCFM